MKANRKRIDLFLPGRRTIFSLAVLLLAAVLAGCSSPGYKKGDTAASSLTESANKIQATGIRVDETLNWLNDLVNHPAADLRPQYQKFSTAVEQLGASAKEVQQSVSSMATKGKDYFATWDKEIAGISNEDLRNRSEARKTELANSFANLKRRYVETDLAFRPFMSDLRDIQKSLGANLSQASVASMKPAASTATLEGARLKESINGLISEFKALGVALSPVTR